jgi:hypothetical protein
VLSTGGEAAHVQFSWETVALDFGPSDFRRPALFFSCVIGQDGRAGMSLSYMHDKIRLEMPPVAGMSWRRGKLRIELDGAQEIIDFPRWTVVWMMHNSDQIRRTLDRWTGHKRVKIFHDVALEDHPNKNGYAVFDLEPLTEIRSLLTEKCRW